MPLIVIVALVIGVAGLLWLLRCKLSSDRELVRLRQQAENQQQLLFSANPYPMWVYDRASLRFVSVNDAAMRTYGFSREEFLGMTVLDIRPHEGKPTLLDQGDHLHPGLNGVGIWHHQKKDGSLLYVEARGFAFERDGGHYELVLANDVTERKLMEEALRQSQASLQLLVDNAPFGIIRSSLKEDRFESLNAEDPGRIQSRQSPAPETVNSALSRP